MHNVARPLSRSIFCASSMFAGFSYAKALEYLHTHPLQDPFLGPLDSSFIQLCAAHQGALTQEIVQQLQARYPSTRFRLHANVNLTGALSLFEASSFRTERFTQWAKQLARIHHILQADAYSWHAGILRHEDPKLCWQRCIDNTHYLEDLLGSPVGIEALYPNPKQPLMLDSWEQLANLLIQKNVYFAIDLSHCQIIAHTEKRWQWNILKDLLTDPHCLEIHLSDNNHQQDAHQIFQNTPIWLPFLQDITPHIKAPIFYESLMLSHAQALHNKSIPKQCTLAHT